MRSKISTKPAIIISRYQKGVDMWSIGCILAELVLGKPLFPGSSTVNQIELIMSTVPPTSKSGKILLINFLGRTH